MLLLCIFICLTAQSFSEEIAQHPLKPNIIMILADDLGWNDVSFHGSPEIPTPNIDALASSGIILNNYYAEYMCTPSRAALMTGKYPTRLGLQHHVILWGEPSGLPLNVDILPQYLKKLGYSTHIVGKWHLGSMKKEYTPNFRGFDTFFGFYGAYIDYYDHTIYHKMNEPDMPIFYGRDLYNGTNIAEGVRGQYATELFTREAKEIIENHNAEEPLFLYLSHLAVHIGNDYMPLQAPPHIVNKFRYIKDENRRLFAAMISALDESVGEVFQALHQKNMLKNSIVIFASDNGGNTDSRKFGFSSNYPLRGKKFSFWEGGLRVPAIIWSPLLKLNDSRRSMQLMHVTDWLPTLYSAAGGDIADLNDIDGHNMWDAFISEYPSPRKDLHNIDPISGMSAIRIGDLKLVIGESPDYRIGKLDPWYGSTGFEDTGIPDSMDKWVYQNGSIVRDVLIEMGLYLPKSLDQWRRNARVDCGKEPSCSSICNPSTRPCLFNITEDPCERNNLADMYPEAMLSMIEAIRDYEKLAVASQKKALDPHSDPRCHGFASVPWLDEEHSSNCPYD